MNRRTLVNMAILILTFVAGYNAGNLKSVQAAYGPSLIGGNGYLYGWSVSLNNHEICSDPYIWSSTKQIDCN